MNQIDKVIEVIRKTTTILTGSCQSDDIPLDDKSKEIVLSISHQLAAALAESGLLFNSETGIRRSGYKVITLCGSTKFKEDFERINKELTLAGNIVISVGCFGHSGDVFTDEQKAMLDDMHKRKIDLADEIFVINKGGYIGNSTRGEIEYATSQNKKVVFMEATEQEALAAMVR